ncbi:PP2C family serine/threonine-protein phosphatase [Leptothrix ochracea]|uniref:PP2C family protein-serine/threonine phosphatase n=2 Tax=Leptothrix ochracea TaxID=735331 RepID=UPI0034E28B85
MFEIQMASLSDAGQRPYNEDALCTAQHGPVTFVVLADGAGGHRGGAIAAQQVVRDLQAALMALMQAGLQPTELTALVQQAHRRLQAVQQDSRGAGRMHTTVVVLWLHAGHAIALWSHVGDSRLYRLRYGLIDHVSSDDSLVQRMVQAGLLSSEQAQVHPARHQLLSALGGEEEIEPHTLPAWADVEDGDAFLLCSDGWWEPLGDERITALCRAAVSPQDWLLRMQREIEAQQEPHQDNYSAVALWVNDPSENTRSLEELKA